MSFVPAVVTLGGVGLCFGAGLATAYRLLEVEVNPKEAELTEALPGINCGACGFPGCAGYAAALAKGEAEPNKCMPGGKETVLSIGKILGIEVEVGVRKVARILCKGGGTLAKRKFRYEGVQDCHMAVLVGGGDKVCRYACLGLGTCERVCSFDAITMDKKSGLPVVDSDKCVSCGACLRECPKKLFEMCGVDTQVNILCSSDEVKGITVKKACSCGCIKCRKCIKVCQVDAVHFENNIIRIDTDKCTNCGDCVKECPTKVIEMLSPSCEKTPETV